MKLKELYSLAKKQGKSSVCRFMKDMKKAGMTKNMKFYQGRFFWTGPAVSCDSVQDVLSNTKVRCQWDHLGLGYIVYPVESVKIKKENEV